MDAGNELSAEELKSTMEFFDISGPGSIATDFSSAQDHVHLHATLACVSKVASAITSADAAFTDGNAGERRAGLRRIGTKFKAAEAETRIHREATSGLVAGAVRCLGRHTHHHMVRSQSAFTEFAGRLLREDVAELQACMAKLTPIAGGASGGLCWWESKKDFETVLDVYNRMLAKGTFKKDIDHASTVAQTAAL